MTAPSLEGSLTEAARGPTHRTDDPSGGRTVTQRHLGAGSRRRGRIVGLPALVPLSADGRHYADRVPPCAADGPRPDPDRAHDAPGGRGHGAGRPVGPESLRARLP